MSRLSLPSLATGAFAASILVAWLVWLDNQDEYAVQAWTYVSLTVVALVIAAGNGRRLRPRAGWAIAVGLALACGAELAFVYLAANLPFS